MSNKNFDASILTTILQSCRNNLGIDRDEKKNPVNHSYTYDTVFYAGCQLEFIGGLPIIRIPPPFIRPYAPGENIWITKIGGTGDDVAPSIVRYSNDRIYVCGQFRSAFISTYNVGNIKASSVTNTTSTSNIVADVFIACYTPVGINCWVTKIGGTNNDSDASISADASNNIYVSGVYNSVSVSTYNSGSPNFISSVANTSTNSTFDMFLARYNSSGINQWLTKFGGTASDVAPSVVTDLSGFVYIAGQYNSGRFSTYNASNTTIVKSSVANFNPLSAAASNIFLTKYSSSGDVVWLTRMGGSSNEAVPAATASLDYNGNIYIAGPFASANFSTSNANANDSYTSSLTINTPPPFSNIFLAQYDYNGINKWVTKITGRMVSVTPASIAVDSSSNVYIAGSYTLSSVSTFNAGDQTTIISTIPNSSAISQEMFLACYNSSGVNQWLTRIGGQISEERSALTIDNLNNIYITGQFTSANVSTYNAGSPNVVSTVTNTSLSPLSDTFIAKYTTSGINQWLTKIGGRSGEADPSITTDLAGNLYITGNFISLSISTYNAGSPNIVSTMNNTASTVISNDVYIAKYRA